MEINGKIIELLPEKSGQSANGTWRKQEYILETSSQIKAQTMKMYLLWKAGPYAKYCYITDLRNYLFYKK